MSLPTPSRFAEAKKLLESLDLSSLTRELVKPSRIERSISERLLELEKSSSLSHIANITQPLPLDITLSSIVADPIDNQDSRVMCLAAQCHDSTSRIRHLRDNLKIIFAAAGLFDQSSLRYSYRIKRKDHEDSLPRVCLMTTSSLGGKLMPSRFQPGKLRTYKPLIDSRELIRTFKDFVWAENIRLERLSICPLGIIKQLRRGDPDAQLSESCSVPLWTSNVRLTLTNHHKPVMPHQLLRYSTNARRIRTWTD